MRTANRNPTSDRPKQILAAFFYFPLLCTQQCTETHALIQLLQVSVIVMSLKECFVRAKAHSTSFRKSFLFMKNLRTLLLIINREDNICFYWSFGIEFGHNIK